MKKVKYSCQLISLLVWIFSINIGLASQMVSPYYIHTPFETIEWEAKNIGEQIIIPIDIDITYEFESAILKLKILPATEKGVDINAVKMETTTFKFEANNTNQQPCCKALVPITIEKEGRFNIGYQLYVKQSNGRENIYEPTYGGKVLFGFFALDGKYTVASDSSVAIVRRVLYNIAQNNTDNITIINAIKVSKARRTNPEYYSIDENYKKLKEENNVSDEATGLLSNYYRIEWQFLEDKYFSKYPSLPRKGFWN